MTYLDGITLIFNNNDYYLINGVFKKGTRILYHDFINLNGIEHLVEDYYKLNSDVFEVNTKLGNFYFESKDAVTIKDLLTNEIKSELVEFLWTYDKLCINKVQHNVIKNSKFEVKDFLYLNQYNYSTSISEILLKYGLPKKFLIKALTTGCPDDEWPEAKEWNKKFKNLLQELEIKDEDDFKNMLLQSYSNEVEYSLRKIKMNSIFATILSLFLLGKFKLKTHTTVDIQCDSEEIFKDVLEFVLTYKLKHSIQNSTYNASYTSTVSINSSLIYDLFIKNFHDLNFILDLPQSFIKKVLDKISGQNFFLSTMCSAKYLQEFLFRSGYLYSIENTSVNYDSYLLSPITNYEETATQYLINIENIKQISSHNLIGINLKS